MRLSSLALAVLCAGCAASPDATDGGADAAMQQNGDAGKQPGKDAAIPPNSDGGGGGPCFGSALLKKLGKTHLLAGASMEDSIAESAPFDLRYLYISGGYFDGDTPCQSCATNCTAGQKSCANSAGGCAWWGCWQYDQVPPGQFLRDFFATAKKDGQVPMVSYYQMLQASGVTEGAPEVKVAAADPKFMARYFADWRFLLQQVGTDAVVLQIEPDFWGYCEQAGPDPHQLAAAVKSANPTDCATQEDSIAGLGKCLIAMVRKYAPNAAVGLHASAWGTNMDVFGNTNPNFDVAGEAKKLANFLIECGASDGDFLTSDTSDRDAGYYMSIGRNTWWDATNMTLPNFHQAFAWGKAVATQAGVPIIWWQIPVGNEMQNDTLNHWKDNRVDYFFAHTQEVVDGLGAAMAFGAGAYDQTDPSTDGGNLVAKVKAYGASGGQALCMP